MCIYSANEREPSEGACSPWKGLGTRCQLLQVNHSEA